MMTTAPTTKKSEETSAKMDTTFICKGRSSESDLESRKKVPIQLYLEGKRTLMNMFVKMMTIIASVAIATMSVLRSLEIFGSMNA